MARVRILHTARTAWACAFLIGLAACGGGSSPPANADAGPSAGGGTGSASAVTSVALHSTDGSASSSVPFTFGQVFAAGDLPAGRGIEGVLDDGSRMPLQLDVKATHPDGSVRHAVISGVWPSLAAGESRTLGLAPAAPAEASSLTPADLLAQGFSADVQVTLGGLTYSASAQELLQQQAPLHWLSGPVAHEWEVSGPLKDAQGNAHPHLSARFALRWYPALHRARVDLTLENDWAYEPAPQNFTYDVAVHVGGSPAWSASALTHYHHARWRKLFWWGAEPRLDVAHDAAYLIATKALPSYDTSVVPTEAALAQLATQWAAAATGPMAPGIVTTAMPMVGGRADIGPLPKWATLYLLSMDPRAKAATLGVGDLAGSWPIHYRDKNTGRPVSLADYPYMTLLGHPGDAVNPATHESEAFPACGGTCTTAPYDYKPDANHQPSMAYLPYLVTGDHYDLEELQFWANWNMLQANPAYRGFEKGWMKWAEVRGQAWSLRTLAQAAYITPDGDALKAYFIDRVGYNLDWYNTAYTQRQPNALGVLDGGQGDFASIAYPTPSGPQTGLAPWQDDFFTWAVGYTAELGFAAAEPLLAWKARFAVGRMTAPGYCWIDGAAYELEVRPSASAPLYGTLAQAYLATMRDKDGSGNPIPRVNSTGALYLDQPCGSQAQADWLTQRDKDNHVARGPWQMGEMTGYATSTEGYPSNMQPALAVAASFNLADARAAWNVFSQRPVKPDYRTEPVWAIVPRTP